MPQRLAFLCTLLALGAITLAAPTRQEQVLNDLKTVGEDESWVYDDIAAGFAEAKRTGKPVLLVFRCIP